MIAAQSITFLIEDHSQALRGEMLANKLGLPIATEAQQNGIYLVLAKNHLEIRFPHEKIKPIYIDFLAKKNEQRIHKHRGRGELIARAVGIKGNYCPSVIDATAGFGRDALILASLGCDVTMVERSSIICALLLDGLNRARKESPNWLPHLRLNCQDAKEFLRNCIDQGNLVEVIYLDPMFPERTKTALVKKEMRIIKKIVGADEDASELFTLAKQCAKKRVVVKRPRLAASITQDKPSVVYQAKTCRFDVYLVDTIF